MDTLGTPWLDVREEVVTALAESRAVVALESTIVVHGLPTPTNLEVAEDCESAVRLAGAVPATVGVLDGRVVVGLTLAELADLADPTRHVAKLSSRDLGLAIARGLDGATTVAGTLAGASAAGVAVMATGGLGGVHRGAATTYDESADLTALSRTSALVVASGVKSILDIGATLERLDSLGVAVAGYRTTRFPGFYLADSGHGVEWSVDSPEEAARAFAAHRRFSASAMLLANPIARASELDEQLHEAALASAFAHAEAVGARGKDVTPILLAEFARFSAGASVAANRDLVVANAGLAGEVAVRLALS
jgi:pseudouridylate synthase